jgi:hypothetical protein
MLYDTRAHVELIDRYFYIGAASVEQRMEDQWLGQLKDHIRRTDDLLKRYAFSVAAMDSFDQVSSRWWSSKEMRSPQQFLKASACTAFQGKCTVCMAR